MIAINDMLTHAARLEPGMSVLIIAHLDGLRGSDNLVEAELIDLIADTVRERDAHPQILWIDQVHPSPFQWELPPTMVGAMERADCVISHSFDFVTEEVLSLRRLTREVDVPYIRNFATTRALMRSDWVQTPHELVREIRYRSAEFFQPGMSWEVTHPNGTHLTGEVVPPPPPQVGYPVYTYYRTDLHAYRPFPEWVTPPIQCENISGVYNSDGMLSYWSRYIGIDPYYEEPVTVELDNSRIVNISGGEVAEKIVRFHEEVLAPRYGDAVWRSRTIHPGVHPNANLSEEESGSAIHRRLADHANMANIHLHLGDVQASEVTFWPHVTADLKGSTWVIGGRTLLDNGYNTTLEHPAVTAIAERYPGRPLIPARPG